jgi:hypothetical protein
MNRILKSWAYIEAGGLHRKKRMIKRKKIKRKKIKRKKIKWV